MSDLVERLRALAQYDDRIAGDIFTEAVDEIKRLTAEVARLRGALEKAVGLLWEHCEGIAPRIEPLEAELAKEATHGN